MAEDLGQVRTKEQAQAGRIGGECLGPAPASPSSYAREQAIVRGGLFNPTRVSWFTCSFNPQCPTPIGRGFLM